MSAGPLLGKWQMVEAHNVEDFMKELGLGLMARKAAAKAKPTLEIQPTGRWRLHIESFKDRTIEFELGKEFVRSMPDGRTVHTTFFMDIDRLVQRDIGSQSNGKEIRTTRWVEGSGRLVETMQFGNVTARRVYTRK